MTTRLLSRLAGTATRAPARPEMKGFSQPPWWALNAPFWDTISSEREKISNDFSGYIQGVYKRNGVIFACELLRIMAFSEVLFAWQRMDDGRPSKLYRTPDLGLLEVPWRNGTTGGLLARMEQDSSMAGNAFITVVEKARRRRLRRLRPDWVTIIAGSEDDDPNALDAEVIGYDYSPGGKIGTGEILLPEEVAHFAPIPDPEAQWRGMSWLTPVLREIEADSAATKHKSQFFKNGATPNVVVTYDKDTSRADFERFVEMFRTRQEGVDNAYRTLHLAGGADAKVVGSSLQQLEFKVTQGAGETRIAAAAGTHPVLVGLSEGLGGSSLNQGNFGAAKRRFSDLTIRPLWRIAAACLQSILPAPAAGDRLWYDDRDVAFLREDAKEAADILKLETDAIAGLLQSGFAADDAVAAVTSGDLRRLAGTHSGLFSVQLQPPGSAISDAPADIDPATADALGALIRAGFEPDAAARALGIPAIAHTGRLPVTVQSGGNG